MNRKQQIAIIDYGSGNLHSASKAVEYVASAEQMNVDVIVTNDIETIAKADKIILPGQGAFGDCMQGLEKIDGMVETLNNRVLEAGVPFLGICVGMQLLAQTGMEHGMHEGLGWIEGKVVKIEPEDKTLKIPHMGWNTVSLIKAGKLHPVSKVCDGRDFYFVHSYAFECTNDDDLLAYTQYGGKIAAIIGKDNITGVQFHPEKSQKAGMELLSGFIRM